MSSLFFPSIFVPLVGIFIPFVTMAFLFLFIEKDSYNS